MNFNVGNIILGLVGIAIGILMIKEAFNLNHHFFFLDFVEKKFGGGTGTLAYRIVGFLVCVFSIFVMLGIIDPNGQNINQLNNNNTPVQIQTNPTNRNGINIAP